MLRALVCACALAAATLTHAATHTVYYAAETGGTYYAYPVGQSLADWTTYRAALTEGSGANVGRYSGSLNDANGFGWLVFSGSSQPASWDAAAATIDLTATAAKASADGVPTALLSTTTSDTGSGTLGRALHYLRLAWVSSGVYSSGALANGPSGEASVSVAAADLIAARINAARGQHYPNRANVWVLQRTASGISVRNGAELSKNPTEVFKAWIDFAGVLGRNEFVQEINSLSVSGGTVAEVADSEGISGNLIYAKYEGGDDGDVATITYDVDTTAGQQLTGTVTLNVAE